MSNSGFERSICIDHHVYNKQSGTWVKQHSKLQPFFNVTTKATTEDYAALGFHLERDTKTASLPAMSDTGCQSCLAGLKVIHRLGLRESDLSHVTMKMHKGSIVMLGLESVPVGERVTWCHMMVVCV